MTTIITDTAVVYQAVWNVELRWSRLVTTFVVAAAVVTEWMMDGFTMTFTVNSLIGPAFTNFLFEISAGKTNNEINIADPLQDTS